MPDQEMNQHLPLLTNKERDDFSNGYQSTSSDSVQTTTGNGTRKPRSRTMPTPHQERGDTFPNHSRVRSRTMPYVNRDRSETISPNAPLPSSFYTIKLFLVFLTVFQLMNLLTMTYTDSVLNYISKRFRIPDTMASFILSSYQIGNMVVIIPVSFYGGRWNKPKVIAIGVFIMILGLICCVLPHFILSPPIIVNASNAQICFENESKAHGTGVIGIDESIMLEPPRNIPCNSHGTTLNPALLLVFGHFLIGSGAAPLWPLGVSYLDEHVVIRKLPIYLGIFIGTTLTGPIFGFLLGSVMSAIYVNLNSHKYISPSSPEWIGAWWLGYLISAVVLAILLFPFSFYPQHLPISSQKQAEQDEIEELQFRRRMTRTRSQLEVVLEREIENHEKSGICSWSWFLEQFADFTLSVQHTLSTPLALTTIVAYIAMANLVSGVSTFGSTYVQREFNVSRITSDMLIGGLCVPFGIIGTFGGGLLMKKFNFDIRQTLLYVIAMALVGSILFSFALGLGCTPVNIAGITSSYSNSSKINVTSTCNADCACPIGQINLICGSDERTYISPCNAGCTNIKVESSDLFKKKTLYGNCSCVGNGKGDARNGPCNTLKCTGMLAGFIIIASTGFLSLSLCQAPVYVIFLRMLDNVDKSLAIGILSFTARVLGYVPGPIWFGLILDRVCIYWGPKCNGKASCLLYNTVGMRYSYIGLCLACGVMYVLAFLISFVWMEKHKERYEKTSVVPYNDAAARTEIEE